MFESCARVKAWSCRTMHHDSQVAAEVSRRCSFLLCRVKSLCCLPLGVQLQDSVVLSRLFPGFDPFFLLLASL